MLSYPLVANLVARQGQGGQGGGPPRVINQPTEAVLQGFRWREIGPDRSGRPYR
jgi:hypothetical protein